MRSQATPVPVPGEHRWRNRESRKSCAGVEANRIPCHSNAAVPILADPPIFLRASVNLRGLRVPGFRVFKIERCSPGSAEARPSRRSRKPCLRRMACFARAVIFLPNGYSTRIRTASFPGTRPAIRSCGGRRIRAWSSFPRSCASRTRFARRSRATSTKLDSTRPSAT